MEKRVLLTEQEVREWLSHVSKKIVCVDVETNPEKRWYDAGLYGISICDGSRACYIDLLDNEQYESIRLVVAEFFSKITTIVAHNASYDLKTLLRHGFVRNRMNIFDTMVAYHLLDEVGEKGLKHLTREYLEQEDVLDYNDAASTGFHSSTFRNYATNDVIFTTQLYRIFREKLVDEELKELFGLEMAFLWSVIEMEMNGFSVDWDKAQKVQKLLADEIFNLEVQLYKELGEKYSITYAFDGSLILSGKYNFGSSSQLVHIIRDKLGIEIPVETKKGAPSTGKKTIERLKNKHPFIATLAKYRVARKLLDAFFGPLRKFEDSDGRIRSRFNTAGTKTGRLSSRDPNLQQLPKNNKELKVNVRDCFIASPGYTMVTCDFAGQELRLLAHLSDDESMIKAFRDGKDLHMATANEFYSLGIPEADLIKGSPALETVNTKYKKERNYAKIINFGIAYGKGPEGFSEDFNVSLEEAQSIVEQYFERMPNVKKAIEDCKALVKKQGFVTAMSGRKRRFKKEIRNGEEYYSNSAFRQAFNFLIQGQASDMMRLAICAVIKERDKHPEYGLRLLATVHDELVCECKTEYVEETSKLIKDCFENSMTLKIPILAEIGTGSNYGEAK